MNNEKKLPTLIHKLSIAENYYEDKGKNITIILSLYFLFAKFGLNR